MRSSCIVFVYLPNHTEAVPAGLLTITQSGRDIASTFVYGNQYRKRKDAVSLDLIDLPLPDKDGVVLRPQQNRSLFGVFRDAAPDAWGRLVINDKYLRAQRKGPEVLANAIDLPEVEYLLRSRPDRVGALDFREKPTDPEPIKKISQVLHLKDLVREAHRIAEHKHARTDIMTLLRPATGMGGARPKTTIEDGGQLWLAKFPMDSDRLPVTRIENAMLDLASKCGIETIDHHLLEVEGLTEPVFMIRRFDRIPQPGGGYERVGYNSSLTALGMEEYEQSTGSYQSIADYLRRNADGATQMDQRQELFRRMVFNVLVNNDDDHLRNHGMLRLPGGRFSLSPVFDIVPRVVTPGVSSVRRLAIGIGEDGRNGTIENMLSNTEPFGLTKEEAGEILCEVATQVSSHWRKCLESSGCSKAVIDSLTDTLNFAEQVLEEIDCCRTEFSVESQVA